MFVNSVHVFFWNCITYPVVLSVVLYVSNHNLLILFIYLFRKNVQPQFEDKRTYKHACIQTNNTID